MKRVFFGVLALVAATNTSVFCASLASTTSISVITAQDKVTKQISGVHNCPAFAVANAEQFFTTGPNFTNTQSLVDSILAASKAKGINLVGGVDADAMPNILSETLQKVRTSHLAIIDQNLAAVGCLDNLTEVAKTFKTTQNSVGILMCLTNGDRSHWVFIGIYKTAAGTQIDIPESANNDYVTPQLPFLRDNILNHFA